MTYKMTPAEFFAKADYEGGIDEAILGYGLHEDDLDDSDPELIAAVAEFRRVAGPLLDNLKDFAAQYEEEIVELDL